MRVAWEEFVRTAELDHLDVGRRLTRHDRLVPLCRHIVGDAATVALAWRSRRRGPLVCWANLHRAEDTWTLGSRSAFEVGTDVTDDRPRRDVLGGLAAFSNWLGPSTTGRLAAEVATYRFLGVERAVPRHGWVALHWHPDGPVPRMTLFGSDGSTIGVYAAGALQSSIDRLSYRARRRVSRFMRNDPTGWVLARCDGTQSTGEDG